MNAGTGGETPRGGANVGEPSNESLASPLAWMREESVNRVVLANTDPSYGDGSGGGNCISYAAKDVAYVSTGFFNASWTPSNPAHDTLRLVVRDHTGKNVTAAGGSPLTLKFADWNVTDRISMFVTTASKPGVIVDQEVKLEWALEYRGTADPDRPTNAICT